MPSVEYGSCTSQFLMQNTKLSEYHTRPGRSASNMTHTAHQGYDRQNTNVSIIKQKLKMRKKEYFTIYINQSQIYDFQVRSAAENCCQAPKIVQKNKFNLPFLEIYV